MHLTKEEWKDLNKLFVILIFGGGVVIFLLSFIDNFNFWRALSNAVIVLFILGILYFVFKRFIETSDEKYIEQSGISEIDKMNPVQFQKYVLNDMDIKNFQTDYNQNIIVNDTEYPFLLKPLQSSVDIEIDYIIDIKEAIKYYELDEGIIVSNAYFSN